MRFVRVACVTVLVGLGGCAEPDCTSACEDMNECRSDDHCAEACDELEMRSETSGCSDQLDTVVRCVDEAEEQCDATDHGGACLDEGGALHECLNDYCDANADRRVCDCIEGTTMCLVDIYPL